jgi:hypothetical protein
VSGTRDLLEKNIMRLLTCNAPFTHKIELFLSGLQYAKFIGVLILIFLDVFTLYAKGFNSRKSWLSQNIFTFSDKSSLLTDLFLKFITIRRYHANSGDL